jgi:hypothetical protein
MNEHTIDLASPLHLPAHRRCFVCVTHISGEFGFPFGRL